MTVIELKKEKVSGKTGIDVAEKIKDMIKDQYPGMPESHAMRLAVLLAKEGLKENK